MIAEIWRHLFMRVALISLLFATSFVSVAAATDQRVAVVAIPEGDWMRVYIAYPRGVSPQQIRQDLAQLCEMGKLEVREWHTTQSQASTVVVCYLRPAPGSGKHSIPVWPFVCALRRFDEIAVAYLGKSTPGRGRVANEFVELQWNSSASGINYLIKIKRRDFVGISDLTAGLRKPHEQGQVVGHTSRVAAVALVVLLALLAAGVTYWSTRKILGAAAAAKAGAKTQ